MIYAVKMYYKKYFLVRKIQYYAAKETIVLSCYNLFLSETLTCNMQ